MGQMTDHVSDGPAEISVLEIDENINHQVQQHRSVPGILRIQEPSTPRRDFSHLTSMEEFSGDDVPLTNQTTTPPASPSRLMSFRNIFCRNHDRDRQGTSETPRKKSCTIL